MILLTLPYPPSANRYWRTSAFRGHARTYLSAEAKAYREEAAWRARIAGVRPIEGRVALTVRLFPHLPKDWQRRARKDPETWDDTVQCIDLGNCEKVLSDALNGVAWLDDKQHRRIVLERMPPDDGGARLEVEIEALAPPRQQGELLR